MSLNAAAIEILIEKGLSALDLLAVARALEIKRDPTGAERQKRFRENKKRESESNDVTVTRYDNDPPPIEDNSLPPPTPSDSSFELSPPSPKKSKPKRKSNGSDDELPDWVPTKEWGEFVDMRRAMRNVPFTPAARRNIVSKLDELRGEGFNVAEVLRESVTKGWRGVFAPSVKPKAAATGPPASFLENYLEEQAQGRR